MTDYLQMLNHWHWFAFALILGSMELLLGTSFFLLWLGLCATSIAIILSIFPTVTWQSQFLIFAVEAILCIVIWRYKLKNSFKESDKPNLNNKMSQYIGRTAILESDITNGRGKIQLDGSSWIVSGEDLETGNKIIITGVDGVILLVTKAD